MRLSTLTRLACAAAFAAFCIAPLAFAQPGGGKGSPRYDPSTEIKVQGTVEEVRQQPCPNGARCAGEHVTLKAQADTFDVHLGPADYWKKNGIELAKGDTIEVTGSRVAVDGKEALIAREVRKGEKTVTLRNARGVPAWSSGRRSG
jgi:hypothetical protein